MTTVRPKRWLLALVSVTFVLACSPDNVSAPPVSFYAEVVVEVDPSPSDTLTRLGLVDSRSIVRWWYAADPVRWRWEVETVGTIIDDGVLLSVGGGDSWLYDDRPNTYQHQTAADMASGPASPLALSAPVGPANVESIDAFVEQWRERIGYTDVALAGESTVLGRRTQVVESATPVGDSSASSSTRIACSSCAGPSTAEATSSPIAPR